MYAIIALALAAGVAPKPVVALHEVRLTAKPAGAPRCAAFFPDGKTIVFAGGDPFGPGELAFFDLGARKVSHAHTAHKLAIHAVAVRADGRAIATGGGAGEVKVWDPDGRVTAHLDGEGEYTGCLAYSADGRVLAHSASGGSLVLRDGDTLKPITPPGVRKSYAGGLAFAPDGTLAVAAWDKVRLLRAPTWAGRDELVGGQAMYFDPRYSADGRLLAVQRADYTSQPLAHMVQVWNAAERKVVREWPAHTIGLAFTPDGRHLIASGGAIGDGRVWVWDVQTGGKVAEWAATVPDRESGGDRPPVRHLAVSPDGKLLVTCGDDGAGRVWDLARIIAGQ